MAKHLSQSSHGPSLPVPDHYTSTFKYFLSVCVPTLRVEQIKKTKTIRRAYIRDIDDVYRRLKHRKKCGQAITHEIFCGTGFYKRREKNCKEKKKDEFQMVFGEN